MHIDTLFDSIQPVHEGRYRCEVTEDWGQGRTLFGGIQAAIAMRAIRLQLPDAPPVWSLQTMFIAPIAPGSVEIEVSVLRSGRAATQIEVRIFAGEQLACLMVALLGATRESTVNVAPPLAPETKDRSLSKELPFLQGIVPEFTRHYAYHWAEGGFPFSGSQSPATCIHLRQRDEGVLDEAHIVALADAIPPPGLSMLAGPAPASTLTWTLELVRHLPSISSTEWWRMDARVISARDGYSSQDAWLYGPDGQLVALSRQLVALFG